MHILIAFIHFIFSVNLSQASFYIFLCQTKVRWLTKLFVVFFLAVNLSSDVEDKLKIDRLGVAAGECVAVKSRFDVVLLMDV